MGKQYTLVHPLKRTCTAYHQSYIHTHMTRHIHMTLKLLVLFHSLPCRKCFKITSVLHSSTVFRWYHTLALFIFRCNPRLLIRNVIINRFKMHLHLRYLIEVNTLVLKQAHEAHTLQHICLA